MLDFVIRHQVIYTLSAIAKDLLGAEFFDEARKSGGVSQGVTSMIHSFIHPSSYDRTNTASRVI